MNLIVYDGVCVLCAHSIRFIAARDRDARFRFVPLQSPYGHHLAARHGISVDDPQSFIAIIDGEALYRSNAWLAVMARLPRWGWTRILRLIPRPVRDFVYDFIARRRYRWFGRYDACPLPPASLRERVIEALPQQGA